MVEKALRSMTSSPFVKSVMTSLPWSGPKTKASAPAAPVSVSLPESTIVRGFVRHGAGLPSIRDILTPTEALV